MYFSYCHLACHFCRVKLASELSISRKTVFPLSFTHVGKVASTDLNGLTGLTEAYPQTRVLFS